MTRRWSDMRSPREPPPFVSRIIFAIFAGSLALAVLSRLLPAI